MGLRGAQPYIVPESSAAKRLAAATSQALRKGMILSKECGYVYTLKADIAGHPLLMETMDLESVEMAVQFVPDVNDWSAHLVRCYITQMRQFKEAKRNAEKAEQGKH